MMPQDLGIGDETGLDDLGQPCDDLVAWDRSRVAMSM